MDNKLEELKFVADLAHNGGMMKARLGLLSIFMMENLLHHCRYTVMSLLLRLFYVQVNSWMKLKLSARNPEKNAIDLNKYTLAISVPWENASLFCIVQHIVQTKYWAI